MTHGRREANGNSARITHWRLSDGVRRRGAFDRLGPMTSSPLLMTASGQNLARRIGNLTTPA